MLCLGPLFSKTKRRTREITKLCSMIYNIIRINYISVSTNIFTKEIGYIASSPGLAPGSHYVRPFVISDLTKESNKS